MNNIPFVATFAKQLGAERLLVHTQCGLYEPFDIRCVQYDEERDSTWIIAILMVSVSDRNRWMALRVHFAVPLEVSFPKYPGATFLHLPNQELVTHIDCKLCSFKEDSTLTDALHAFGVMSKRSVSASPWMSQSSVAKLISILRYALQKVGLGANSRFPDYQMANCRAKGIRIIPTCFVPVTECAPVEHQSQPSGGYNEVVNKP